jgi:hypothetical protein
MLVTLFSQQAPRPKLELVFSDEGDGVDPSEDVDVECLSSSDFEAVSLSSSALQSEPSAAVLTFDPADVEQSEANELAAVSIVPDGEITAPGIVVFDDVPSSVGRLGEVEGEGEGKEILQGTHVPTDALIRAVAPWSGRPSSQDGEEFDRPTPPASLDRAMARVIAERYKTCVQIAEEPKGCHEGCQEEGKMSGEEENPVSLVFLSKPVRKKDEDRVTGQERIDGAVTDRREGPETSPMNT